MEDYGVFWQVTVLNPDGTPPPPAAVPGCSECLSIAAGFPALESTQARPPDVDISVGPDRIVLPTNDRYVIRDKAGKLVASVAIADFYRTVLPVGEGVVDSETVFDVRSQRFFIGASGSAGLSGPSSYLLAVSKSPSPSSLGPSDWYLYALDGHIDRLASGDRTTPYNVDGTTVTVGANVVVMTARMEEPHLGPSNAGQYLKIRVMDKTAAIAGTLSTWIDIVDVTFPGSTGVAIGLHPAIAYGDAPGILFAQATGCGIAVWSLADVVGTRTLTSAYASAALPCAVNYARQPVDAPQPGGAAPLRLGVGTLPSRAVYRDGFLWIAHMTAWDFPSGSTTVVRWAQIDLREWPARASISQQGLIGGDAVSTFFPGLASNLRGDVVIVFGRSSANEAPSIYVTGRLVSDVPNTMREPTLLRAGATPYELPGYGGENRWGDYFGAAWDALDDTLWVCGQYAVSPDRSGTWVGRVLVGAQR